ncbi:MAG: hypothetical protein DRI57_10200 [Deltaproteobacteria bacterium]|nr:MAG: hypothetical protein DRI57_10200 [Deltaproteobacteria bacterium]
MREHQRSSAVHTFHRKKLTAPSKSCYERQIILTKQRLRHAGRNHAEFHIIVLQKLDIWQKMIMYP